MKTFTAGALAERFHLKIRGDANTTISAIATLANAQAYHLSFLANPRYKNQLETTQAGIVVTDAASASDFKGTALIAKDPYRAYAEIAQLFQTSKQTQPGIHPTAVIDPTAHISPTVCIGPYVTIGEHSVVHENCTIATHCVIGENCVIGQNSTLAARVTLVANVTIGRHARIHPGAVIGAEGFGLVKNGAQWVNVPQLGGVRIGDYAEIGANSCVDRGAIDDTVIEDDVRIDNLVQIAHNCHIGAHTAIAGCTGIAGSAKIGKNCLLGGHVGVVGHLEICDNVIITGRSVVRNSIQTPGVYSSGTPLTDTKTWRKNAARFKQLDELSRSILAMRKEKE